jgi:hypothetical protein
MVEYGEEISWAYRTNCLISSGSGRSRGVAPSIWEVDDKDQNKRPRSVARMTVA